MHLSRDAPVAKRSGPPTSDARSFRVAKVARGRAQKLQIPISNSASRSLGLVASLWVATTLKGRIPNSKLELFSLFDRMYSLSQVLHFSCNAPEAPPPTSRTSRTSREIILAARGDALPPPLGVTQLWV